MNNRARFCDCLIIKSQSLLALGDSEKACEVLCEIESSMSEISNINSQVGLSLAILKYDILIGSNQIEQAVNVSLDWFIIFRFCRKDWLNIKIKRF